MNSQEPQEATGDILTENWDPVKSFRAVISLILTQCKPEYLLEYALRKHLSNGGPDYIDPLTWFVGLSWDTISSLCGDRDRRHMGNVSRLTRSTPPGNLIRSQLRRDQHQVWIQQCTVPVEMLVEIFCSKLGRPVDG